MFGVCSSSANTYVFGALVACTIKSDAARGEVADLLRARKGSRALRAFVCSMVVAEKGQCPGSLMQKASKQLCGEGTYRPGSRSRGRDFPAKRSTAPLRP
jgi:hypothetical protein